MTAARVHLVAPRARVDVRPEGAAIAAITLRPADRPVEVLARTPWADAPPGRWRMTNTADEWHRTYPGGWHVLLPRALGPAVVDGLEQPFHGEAAWRSWELDRLSEGACLATVELRSLPLRLERELSLAETADGVRLVVAQRIVNLSDRDLRIGWVEHPAFDGRLLADADVTLNGASAPIAPLGASSFADDESVDGLLRIDHRPSATRIDLEWDPAVFPRTYLWQERCASAGFPWHRRVDAIGVEPATQRHDLPEGVLGDLPVAAGATVASRLALSVRFGAVERDAASPMSAHGRE